MYLFRWLLWNNGSIVNVNMRVSNEWILYKVTCGGRAGASPEWTLLQVCVYLDGSNAENKISLLVILCIIMYVKKKKTLFFFFFYKTDYGKMIKYREKYRSTDISVDL